MTRALLLALVAAAGVATAARAGGAPVALPVPARSICAEGPSAIVVGVRSTDNPPGPRRYAIEIRGPDDRRVFRRRGLAPRAWRIWRYDPPRHATGRYTTTYRLAWATHVFPTRVAACRRR